jgi:hypothetical protein
VVVDVARGPVGPSNLDRWTHSDRGGVVDPYAEGHVAVFLTDLGAAKEAVILERSQPVSRPRARKRLRERVELRAEMSAWDLSRSVARARKNMRHKLLLMRADRIFTFTKRGGFERAELWGVWERFLRQVRRSWPEFQAVAVPELHTGGGENSGRYHLHVALNQFYNVSVMRLYWHRALGAAGILRGGESPGNVQASRHHASSVVRLARYLAKYLSKGQGDQVAGTKRYSTCGNIPEALKRTVYLPAGPAAVVVWRRLVREFCGGEPKSHYLFDLNGERGIWFSSE